jgi:hypothetical protein
MEAVATIGAHSLSRVDKSLQPMLTDEVKIAFDNATGNEIFFRKYKVEKFEGRVRCIVKECTHYSTNIRHLQIHCLYKHEIIFSIRDEFILNIKLKQRKIDGFDMSSKDARNITNLPESGSVSNDCVKVAGIIGESSSSIADNNLRYILKDEVINAFENYIGDNHYGGKYKISIVDSKFECIIKGCDRRYKQISALYNHCISSHDIRIVIIDKNIIAIEKVEPKESLCDICSIILKDLKALRDHHFNIHGRKCEFKKNILLSTTEIGNKLPKINKPDTDKVQDNTSVTKTTTDNMDSNRKRSHATATHEEESNAKNAKLNPSESGYPQSDLFISISSSWDNGILSITEYNSVDDTPATGNNDLITTDVQPSATSENIDDDKELLELAQELAENNSDFQDALNKDVADKYATSRDSYLQFSVTPKKYK